jgi:trehalose/maltose hydrolase-like predicted phosphorylase
MVQIPRDWFIFHSQDPNNFIKRAFLGNGYQGIDISNNFGQGFGVHEARDYMPVTYLGGVYSTGMDGSGKKTPHVLFRPLNMYTLIPADQQEDNIFETMAEFSQELDMQQAVVITKGLWNNYRTTTELFLSRDAPQLGIMKFEFVPLQPKEEFHFKYLVRKHIDSDYQQLTMRQDGEFTFFEGEISEDYNQFHGLGPLRIIQGVNIDVINSMGQSIPHQKNWVESATGDFRAGDECSWSCDLRIPGDTAAQGATIIIRFLTIHSHDPSIEIPEAIAKVANTILFASIMSSIEELRERHIRAWNEQIWNRIIQVGDEALQRRIISCMYALGCSLRAGYPNSAGPNGINGSGWESHIFWDADLWMNLGVNLWAPELARSLTEFRHKTVAGARQHRIDYITEYEYENVTDGIKFPWQSTTSGIETSPPGWAAQEHITCDVIFGQYMYYTITKDDHYLKSVAFPLCYEAAVYLGQRVERGKDGKYHFLGVVPADEHPFPNLVDDNALTNLYTVKVIQIVIGWCKKLGKPYPPHWDEICTNMFYNFDAERNLVIEFTGYRGQSIKQADTDILTFPLEWPFSREIKRNNMLYYFDRLPPNHIMMGSSIFSVIACELGMEEKAWEYFIDQYPHFHPDAFYNASESPNNTCWPFLTGMGGFLMNLMYGFGGLRLRSDGLLFDPILPPALPEIEFSRINFQGVTFSYRIWDRGQRFNLQLLESSKKHRLKLYFRPGHEYRLSAPDGLKMDFIQPNLPDSELALEVELLFDHPIELKSIR